MIEFVDDQTGEVLGVEYSPAERKTALAAVALYKSQLLARRIVDDNDVIATGVEVCERVSESLEDGLTVVAPETHKVLEMLHLPFIADMHEQLPPELYATVCRALGLTPFELFTHGITARQMLNEQDVEPRILRGNELED